MSHSHRVIEELKGSLRELSTKKKLTFNICDDFFDQIVPQSFAVPEEELCRINKNYKYEEIYEEEDKPEYYRDDAPVRARHMMLVTNKVFSKKPQPKQKQEKIVERDDGYPEGKYNKLNIQRDDGYPEGKYNKLNIRRDEVVYREGTQIHDIYYDRHMQPIHTTEPQQKQAVLADRDTQSDKPQLGRTFNCPIQIIPATKTLNLTTYNTATTNTKSCRLRNEATNTEALIPQFEAKFMEFLQCILNDAPLLVSSQPNEEAIGDLLLQFLEQILRDAPPLIEGGETPVKNLIKNVQPTSIAEQIPQRAMPALNNCAVQLDIPSRMDNGTQSQGNVTINQYSREESITLQPRPISRCGFLQLSDVVSASEPLDIKTQKVSLSHTNQILEIPEIRLPPSLKVDNLEKYTVRPVDKPKVYNKVVSGDFINIPLTKKNLQFESHKPTSEAPDNRLKLSTIDSKTSTQNQQSCQTDAIQPDVVQPAMEYSAQVSQKLKQPKVEKIKIPDLPSCLDIPSDVGDLSNFSLPDSDELNMTYTATSLITEEYSYNTGETTSTLTGELNSSKLRKILGTDASSGVSYANCPTEYTYTYGSSTITGGISSDISNGTSSDAKIKSTKILGVDSSGELSNSAISFSSEVYSDDE